MSKLQDELRRNGKIPLGDKIMLYGGEWRLLKPGDTYLAHTEGQEPDILTVRRVEVQKRRTGAVVGKVFPKERKKKLYDLHEVVKITFIDNPNSEKEKKDEPKPERARPEPERGESAVVGGLPKSEQRGELEGDRVPSSDERSVPRAPRPIPRPPRRGGGTDYAAAGKRASAERHSPADGDSNSS